MQLISIGRIVKPVGLKGEVKVLPLTKDTGIFAALESVYIGGKPVALIKARVTGGNVFLTLGGIVCRDGAEAMRGAELQIERARAKQPDEGEYFVGDLIGCKVVADGADIGILTEVLQHGAADVFVVKGADGKDALFPHLARVVIGVDLSNKIITLDKGEFEKVVVRN